MPGWAARLFARERNLRMVWEVEAFPTCCPPVIEERDPVLLERMIPDLEHGDALVCVGILHCPGLVALLRERGYAVTGSPTP